ncbi:MAG: ThuA domain-containing protein, partial [Verrucomicrobia bacterium]|nr:ThuA domain-containing protein [Verrucomicrobiota bacterium]
MPRAIIPQKWIAAALLLAAVASPAFAEKITVLFVDGQNNHNWKA